MGYYIKDLESEDIHKVIELAEEVFEYAKVNGEEFNKQTIETKLIRNLFYKDTLSLVVVEDDNIIGFCEMILTNSRFNDNTKVAYESFWHTSAKLPLTKRVRIMKELFRRMESWAIYKGAKLIKMYAPVWTSLSKLLDRNNYKSEELSMIKVVN